MTNPLRRLDLRLAAASEPWSYPESDSGLNAQGDLVPLNFQDPLASEDEGPDVGDHDETCYNPYLGCDDLPDCDLDYDYDRDYDI